jgi:hypothetical protein
LICQIAPGSQPTVERAVAKALINKIKPERKNRKRSHRFLLRQDAH